MPKQQADPGEAADKQVFPGTMGEGNPIWNIEQLYVSQDKKTQQMDADIPVFADRILVGDSRDLSLIPDNAVQLTVTPPPYRNAINYELHSQSGGKAYYRGNLSLDSDGYFEEMEKILFEVHRVTKEGGYCAVVIGNEVAKGELNPLPHILTARLVKKWRFHEDIIWSKITGGLDRFGVTIQHPYPSYFRANIMHEHILVFRKGGVVHTRDEKSRLRIDEVMKRDVSNSIWNIPPVPPHYIDHPAPFPEEIPYRLITIYSNIGDIVLDPFNGSGTTTKVAKHLKRHFIGLDKIPEYVELAKKRLKEPLHLREQLCAEWKRIKPSTASQAPLDTY